MVPFVSQQLNNLELALSLAKRGNLPGAEALVGQNFDRLFASGQFKEAAEAAAESPQVYIKHGVHNRRTSCCQAFCIRTIQACRSFIFVYARQCCVCSIKWNKPGNMAGIHGTAESPNIVLQLCCCCD